MKEANAGLHAPLTNQRIYVIAPSGPVVPTEKLDTAVVNLQALGFKTNLDRGAKTVNGRFAGTDRQRLQALTRALKQPADIVMAARGGYGMTRLLPSIDWHAVA
ncbi:MAG: LD-carboxypeptidase, partial [Orrella sp.]